MNSGRKPNSGGTVRPFDRNPLLGKHCLSRAPVPIHMAYMLLPLITLGAVALAVLGVVLLMNRLFIRQSLPATRAELAERIRRLSQG